MALQLPGDSTGRRSHRYGRLTGAPVRRGGWGCLCRDSAQRARGIHEMLAAGVSATKSLSCRSCATLPSQPPGGRLRGGDGGRRFPVPVAAGFLRVLELDPLGGQPTQGVLDLARATPPRHRPQRDRCIPQSPCRTPSQSNVVQRNSSGRAAAPRPLSGSPAGSQKSLRIIRQDWTERVGFFSQGQREPT